MTYDKALLPDDLKEMLMNASEDSTEYLAHYTSPITGWEWFATSLRMVNDEPIFFGYVEGEFGEWGSFTMDDLEVMDAYLGRDDINPMQRK